MKKTFVLALSLLALTLFGGLASAQTSTSTSTATATNTATPTAVATVTPTATSTSTSTATAIATFPIGGHQGIDYQQLSSDIQQRIAPAVDQTNRLYLMGGSHAFGLLRIASNVANQETVTIGTNVFEYQTIQTTTGLTTASGQWNVNTNGPLSVTMTAHGLVAGQALAVEGELFNVLRVVDANTVVVARSRYGTVAAAHANGVTIYKGAALAVTTDIPVGLITTFTPTIASVALTAAINNAATSTLERVVGTTGTVGTNTIYDPGSAYTYAQRIGKVIATRNSDSSVSLVSAVAENSVLATTETLAGSNNVFSTATMAGGVARVIKRLSSVVRVPTATEVTLGTIYVPFGYVPTAWNIRVQVTSSGAYKAWGGTTTVSGNNLILTNNATTDWAATDTIYLSVYE